MKLTVNIFKKGKFIDVTPTPPLGAFNQRPVRRDIHQKKKK